MENDWIRIDAPIPPEPILENAVGYHNQRGVRHIALWWEPAGDEVMISDGFVTFTGHWSGYLAFIHHPKVYPHLAKYPLGSSDEPARARLVIDLQNRQAFIAPVKEAERFLAAQWRSDRHVILHLSLEEMENWVESIVGSLLAPTEEDLLQQMEEDRRHVIALLDWLEHQTASEDHSKGGMP